MERRDSLILDRSPLRSTAVGDAQARISAVFSPHTLEVVSPREEVDVTLRLLRLSRLTLGELSHGVEVDVTPGKLRTYYNVNVVLDGHTRTSCGREISATSSGNAAILSPEERATMRWSADCRQLAVKIDRTALEEELEAHLGRPVDAPLVFRVLMDTSAGLGRNWLQTVMALIDQVNENPLLAEQPLVLRRFESLLISQLLAGQPHNYTDDLTLVGRRRPRPRRIQAVIDLIEERPGDPLTAADMARVAGVSLRSLQDDFRAHVGVPPMTYLRNVRLTRAHEDLRRGATDGVPTVADIAYRWGFGHVPRFAASYRDRFGESPSDTLRA